MPKGPLGCWITKKSKSVLGGSPVTLTFMTSTGPRGWMMTVPEASGTQAGTAFRAGERTIGNVNVLDPPPLANALGTNPASARPQSTAILAINEVNFVYVVLMLTSPTIMGLGTDRFE